MIADIFIHLIPKFWVFFSVAGSTEVVRIYKFVPFTFGCLFFNSFMNINKFSYQTVVFLMIFIFNQITFLLSELKWCMVFICLDIEIFNLLFLFRFLVVFRKFESMNLIFYCLFFYICCKASFFSTSSIRSLNCLF